MEEFICWVSFNLKGGYGILAGGEIQKTFKNLPDHKIIRIAVNYHFIDAWHGGIFNNK